MTEQHGCAFEGCCSRRSTSVRLIDPRMRGLARCLTLFQYVQAVTGGPVALRLDADGVDTAVVARDGESGAVAVRLLDADGRIVRQGRLLSERDRLAAGTGPARAPRPRPVRASRRRSSGP